MRGKKLFKSGFSIMMALTIAAGLTFSPTALIKSDAKAASEDEVFFNASLEASDSFRGDAVYENLAGNNLRLGTPADAFITPEGYLQINYKSSTSASEDGSFTIWGEGGNFYGGDQGYVKFRLRATEADYASQFSVSFYNSGNNQGTFNFAKWLADSGYTEADIQSAVGDKFVEFRLNVPNTGSYQGMKIKFNQGNSSGTLFIDSITFGETAVFDNFDYSTGRGNYYIDEYGNLPMYRPSSSLNGEYAGCNYAGYMMWSVSTMMSNMVNNSASGERALQIHYDTDVNSYTVLKGTAAISNEPVLAMTVKGDAGADECMYVILIKDGAEAARIPVSDFTAEAGTSTAASISGEYSTIYASIPSGVSFDSVGFLFVESSSAAGNVYVADIYFPRYSYTVEHYFDGTIDASKNETYNGLKFGESIENGYTDNSDNVYSLSDTIYSDTSKKITGSADSIKVYYVSSVDYTINYYYDGVKDSTKTETGSDKLGTVVAYTDKNITGYKLDKVSADSISLGTGKNVIDVYYIKDSFGYSVNYYYDGVKDDTKTVNGSAVYKDEINTYEDKNITGYKLEKVLPDSIIIGVDVALNVINVYYVKDSFGYTVNYYYDGVKDDAKTESGTALYQSSIGYTDKNITGYKFDHASADKITISENASANVINVYYVKDSFGYTIEYYYDGIIDDAKTETGTALYQSTVNYTDKPAAGFEFVSASPESLVITEIEESNVIRVYYARDSFGYTINYYYDGVQDESKTISGTAIYQTEVGYEDKNITGYKFDHASAEKITISDNAASNVINVYYVKDSFGYTINYYYDGVLDAAKTVKDKALYQSTVGYTDKNITGYKFDHASADEIIISEIAESNVINVYYVKDSFGYTINYYYDGELDEEKTETGTAVYQSEVGYEDKNITGYKFDSASAETITISAEETENVIDVYYVKDSFGYTINYYYDGELDEEKTETGTAVYQSEVGYEDKNITGYKFDSASAETITISAEETENVIDVYYVKDSFGYTINYYYDGELDEEKTETGTAVYQSEVGYEDKNITGYKFDSASAETITISAEETENVIDVYYVKDSFGYTINYYYDGELDEEKTEAGTAVYQSEVGYEDKNITGYKFDSASAETITISAEETENVIDVYYVKDSFGYTINYYYDGELDEEKTETGTAVYQSEVVYQEQPKEGYKLIKTEPEDGKLVISENAEENIINIYYEKYSVDYTIEYYYDNVKDEKLTVNGSGKYGETVTYKPQLKDGYRFVKATAENIKLGDDENIIKVYYEKLPETKPAPSAPSTGDTASVLPIILMLLSLGGIVAAVYIRRRAK